MASPITVLLLVISAAVVALLPPPCVADNVMYSGNQDGSTLPAGKSLTYGSYSLKMQKDCNLVLYDGNELIWQTGTTRKGNPGCSLSLLSNGGLVVSTAKSEVVWTGGQEGEESYYVLVLQKDRNLVVYGGPRWATGTNA